MERAPDSEGFKVWAQTSRHSSCLGHVFLIDFGPNHVALACAGPFPGEGTTRRNSSLLSAVKLRSAESARVPAVCRIFKVALRSRLQGKP